MSTRKLKEFYPAEDFYKAYPMGDHTAFIIKGLTLLEEGYGISEIHDILEERGEL